MMQDENQLIGTVFAGCKVLEKIGQGGMGAVYKARHEALDKLVCVKLLSPELAREERNVEFFLREARSAAKLDHPNIVHVYNFGQENSSYFIVMSYVEGKSLQDILNEKGPLPLGQAAGIMIGVLEGLAHAHSKTIIHRDIKPSNILITPDGEPRIADFGLARSINEEKQLTMAGEMVGTAYFMSPEQGLAAKVDHRADLYSVGATLYYILTGKYPFDGKSSIEVIHKHIGEPLPNIVLQRPDLPLWVSGVVDRLMRKKPEDRYQSAAEAIEDLKKHKDEDPAAAAVKNAEISLEFPEITRRMQADAPPPPPPPEARPAAQLDPSDSRRRLEAMAEAGAEAARQSDRRIQEARAAAAQAGPAPAPRLQLAGLHNSIKISMHGAVTFAGICLFLLAGSVGGPQSLGGPLAAAPVKAAIFAALGAGLMVWGVMMKPLKFTMAHGLALAAGAFCAYAAGAYSAPEHLKTDAISGAFSALRAAAGGLFARANAPVLALLFFLLGAKAVYRGSALAKMASALFFLVCMLLTFSFFRGAEAVAPEKSLLAAAGILAAGALALGVARRTYWLVLNPPLLMLAANLLLVFTFSGPRIENLTARNIAENRTKTDALRREAYFTLQQAMANEVPEYDNDGRPVYKRPQIDPEKDFPYAPESEMRAKATEEYAAWLGKGVLTGMASAGGVFLAALVFWLLALLSFAEESIFTYKDNFL